MWNLTENAVKYRREGVPPVVEVRGRRVGGRYELRVSDNGRGMDPKEARHAFEPFFRSEEVRDLPGTGLGLSIVQRVVEASGGRVSLQSTPGRGSTFIVNLELD
jgi:signal transduction histidine kinase